MNVVDIVHDEDNSDNNKLEGQYSSELEELIGSIDSIAKNTDFISLY